MIKLAAGYPVVFVDILTRLSIEAYLPPVLAAVLINNIFPAKDDSSLAKILIY